MVTGTVPFKAPNMEELHKLILKGEFTYPCELTDDAKEMINGLLKMSPKDRLTIPQILSHGWLKETNEYSDEESEAENAEENPAESTIGKLENGIDVGGEAVRTRKKSGTIDNNKKLFDSRHTKQGAKAENGGEEGKKEGNDEREQVTEKAKDESTMTKGAEIDLKSIQGNINYVNVDNLFYDEDYGVKLSYTDYCCITEDFTTHNIGKSRDF
jgi:serine/threonine protein kinase